MRALVDLTGIDDWERDFLAIMRFGAYEAGVHDDPAHPTVVGCLAPDDHTRRIAEIINRTWGGMGRKVTVIVDTEPEALASSESGRPGLPRCWSPPDAARACFGPDFGAGSAHERA